MESFETHTGRVATLDRADVDTDQIIPKQFLKRIERTGFGQFLFYDWRFGADGRENPEFELNRPEYQSATILVTRRNFGCGSSREHAVWALADYGFRSIIAPSFADIFYNNSFKNGLLPVVLSEEAVDALLIQARSESGLTLTVDLPAQQVQAGPLGSFNFEIDGFRKECLLAGLDDIGLTLQYEAKIAAYESRLEMRAQQ